MSIFLATVLAIASMGVPRLAVADTLDAVSLMTAIMENIINPAILLLLAVTFAIFVYGIFRSFNSKSSQEMKDRGKQIMVWGLVGLFVMVGVYGIMQFIIDIAEVDEVTVHGNGQIDLDFPDFNTGL